jgi:hypothetical protein
MDVDVARILHAYANDVAQLPYGSAPKTQIERTHAALRAALTLAAGRPNEVLWSRFFSEGCRLVACVDDGSALPRLRAFLAENADLHQNPAELVRS